MAYAPVPSRGGILSRRSVRSAASSSSLCERESRALRLKKSLSATSAIASNCRRLTLLSILVATRASSDAAIPICCITLWQEMRSDAPAATSARTPENSSRLRGLRARRRWETRSKELSNCRKAAEQSALVGPNSSWRNWRKNRDRISSNEVKVASPGEITKPNRLMTSASATGETGTTSTTDAPQKPH